MSEEISRLIALQELDSELAGLGRETEGVRQAQADREKAVSEREAQAGRCRAKAVELEQSRETIKAAGEEAAERIKERQVRMMQVQTSREHQALLKEIEDAKRQIKDTEDQLLQVMEDAEAELKKAAELENICKGERKLLAEEAAKAAEAVRQIEARRAEVLARRDQLALELPEAQRRRYEKLLAKRKGLAVVRVSAGVCQGCFMTVPPQLFNQVRKGGEICSCPACQRILFYIADENEPPVQPVRPRPDDDHDLYEEAEDEESEDDLLNDE
ncbi:zinc ribbon domain-containing protein [Candidatus Electronema sp. TJ]|uniref:zinc ribbon domain-containing protein n=1 Tax=Candidatus Electronema sp. TJ TaxID=3401573 RepID=UPI003AA9725B